MLLHFTQKFHQIKLIVLFLIDKKLFTKPIAIKYIFAILILCNCFNITSAQKFPVFTFAKSSINNILPTDAVSYVYKDSKGFIWISSIKGLCCYDGSNVKVFSNNFYKSNSLAGSQPGHIIEDKEGNIWTSHTKGVSRYNRNRNDFTNYSFGLTLNKDTAKLEYNSLSCSKNNEIVLGDIKGYNNFYFDKKADCFKSIKVDTINDGFNSKQGGNTLVGKLINAKNSNDLYLISLHGVFSYDIQTGIKKRISNCSLYSPMDLYKDDKGQLWISEWDGGLSIINPATKELQNIIPNKTVVTITDYKDANGKLWIVASEFKTGSIAIIDPVTKKYTFQVIKTENGITPNVLAGQMINVSQGCIYFVSANGLYQMQENRQSITNVFTYKIGSPIDIYYDNLVRSGTQLQSGDYVFGKLGANGLLVYDSNLVLKKTIKNYSHNGKQYDLDVKSFYKIKDNKYFLTGSTGIAVYKNGKITPLIYCPKKKQYSGALVISCREMLPIDNDNYWIRLVAGGMVQFNTVTNTLSKPNTTAIGNIPLNTIFCIINDAQGKLWAISNEYVFTYNNGTKQFEALPINTNKKMDFNMRSACFDADQNLWITGVGGLLHYNTKTKKETYYNEKNGLKEEDVYKVLPYDNNSIIITHKTGVTHFNYRSQIFTNINNKTGFPYSTNEYDAALILDDKKNLLIGNTGVITKIKIPHFLDATQEKTNIAITQIEGSNKDEQITLDGNIKKVDLHFENFPVNILFSIVNYTSKEEKIYYYRYAGKDSTWIKCINGVVPVNTIEPGTYTIEVTGAIDGKFVAAKDNITFTIVPRWFETIWFKIAAWILSIFVLIILYRWRINTAKKSQVQETEIQRLAAQEYKNQLELNQISNYFSTSLIHLETEEEVLWDVAKNLIGTLGFEDCIIYLWNKDKTKLVQRAGYGPKGSIEEINKQPFDVVLGQGVVGNVALQKESILINDTKQDTRYRVDEMERLSEICVPILHNNELIGVIDSEHSDLNFYTQKHLQSLTTIAAHLSNKLEEIKSKQAIKKNSEELQKTLDLLKGAQLEALRSQMNPHFIFNCLNSIKLYTTQNDTVAASNYLTKFSKLIRMALENSRSETITLAAELEALELYIEMEAMRFKDKLKYNIHVNDNVDSEFIEISPLLLQPYVENAIWHGLMHREEGGRIDIHVGLVPQKQILVISIKDDGVGREKSTQLKSKTAIAHKSFGTKVTGERLDLINQIYNTGASVHTEDVLNNGIVAGTLVTIQIPFE